MTDTTTDIYSQEHFYKSYKVLSCASHWQDLDGGLHKLTANLKLVYHHRLDQYNSYRAIGSDYYETNDQVADAIGIKTRTITNNINPVLVKMGLLQFNRFKSTSGLPCYHVAVGTLDSINGSLVNPKLVDPLLAAITTTNKSNQEWQNYQMNKKKITELELTIAGLRGEITTLKKGIFNKPKHGVTFTLKDND